MRPFEETWYVVLESLSLEVLNGRFSKRWNATFDQNANISDLRRAVKDTNGHGPSDKGLRSICWKAFLLFENLDKSTWTKILTDSRSAYGALRQHFLKDIEHPDNIPADPLTADDNVRHLLPLQSYQ